MNLALGALIISLLAIPGIIFRVTYLDGPYSKRNINTSILDEIIISFIPAIILHFVFFLLIRAAGYAIDFQFLYNTIIGNVKEEHVNVFNVYFIQFFLYTLVLSTTAYFLSSQSRKFVLKRELDRKWTVLEIYNKWYYRLKPSGDSLENRISVWVDLLLELKSESVIYRGFVNGFTLGKDGELKELFLENVRRRVLTDDPIADQGIENRYYNIPGSHFIIRYADVKNMNITYFAEEES